METTTRTPDKRTAVEQFAFRTSKRLLWELRSLTSGLSAQVEDRKEPDCYRKDGRAYVENVDDLGVGVLDRLYCKYFKYREEQFSIGVEGQ